MQNQFSNSAHQQSNQMQPKSQNCPKRNTPHKVSKNLKTISQPAEKKQETKSNTRRKKKKETQTEKPKPTQQIEEKTKNANENFSKNISHSISRTLLYFLPLCFLTCLYSLFTHLFFMPLTLHHWFGRRLALFTLVLSHID